MIDLFKILLFLHSFRKKATSNLDIRKYLIQDSLNK